MKTFFEFLREADDLDIKINVEGKNYLIEQLAENLALIVKKRKTKSLRITTINGYINKEIFSYKGYMYETYLQVTLSNKDVISGKYNSKTNNICVKINEEDVYDLNDETFDNEVLVDKMVEKYKIHLRSNRFSVNENNSKYEIDLYSIIEEIEECDSSSIEKERKIEKSIKEVVLGKKVLCRHLNKQDNDLSGKSSIVIIDVTDVVVEYDFGMIYFLDEQNIKYNIMLEKPVIIMNVEEKPKIRWFKKGKLEK